MTSNEYKEIIDSLKLSTETKKLLIDKSSNIIESISDSTNIDSLKLLITKIDGLVSGLKTAKFTVNKNGLVETKNIPKLIDMFFEYLNEGNIYYQEQTVINEVVKYLNGKLSPLVENSYVDKKIFKRILYNIKESKIELSYDFDFIDDHFFISINLQFTYKNNTDNKIESFPLKFFKHIKLDEKFENSKWLFSMWTLNDFVDALKSCVKWLKFKQKI